MKIYAHRGASHDFPEMSLAAYIGAVEQGADGFECDLRLTQDNVLICWHDDDLMRIASSALVIARSTLAELRSVTEIITFEELLEIALTHKKSLALETKHPVPTRGQVELRLIEILAVHRDQIKAAEIDIAIMSFSWRAIRRIRRSGYLGIYLIAHRWQRWVAIGGGIGPGIFLLRSDQSLGKKLKRKHRQLYIWTVNTAQDLRIAYDAKADVVMSDRPAEMKAALKKLTSRSG